MIYLHSMLQSRYSRNGIFWPEALHPDKLYSPSTKPRQASKKHSPPSFSGGLPEQGKKEHKMPEVHWSPTSEAQPEIRTIDFPRSSELTSAPFLFYNPLLLFSFLQGVHSPADQIICRCLLPGIYLAKTAQFPLVKDIVGYLKMCHSILPIKR